MTRSETVPEDTDFIPEDIASTPEAIEPGSLEWFRAHAPLPLVLRAFYEVEQNQTTFRYDGEDAESMAERDEEVWKLIAAAEGVAELFELHHADDPNAKEIAARIRRLTGCKGRLGYNGY
jgi:hypothetical protein